MQFSSRSFRPYLASMILGAALCGAVENAAAQTDGTFRIVTLGNVSLWNEGDGQMVTGKTPADEGVSRFVLSKQADGSFKITTKANGRHLHVDGGGDKLLSTRYQPDDDFTRFIFEQQADMSYRIKVKADNRYLRDAGKPDGGALGSIEQKDDQFSRFLLFDPDCKQFEDGKVTIANSRTRDAEVFRITRTGEEVRHDPVLNVRAGQQAAFEIPAGFRWVVRDSISGQELLRFASVSKRPVSFALADKGNATVRVPDLVDLSKAAAETALQNLGLKGRSVEGVLPPNASKAGQVYNQSIQAKALVPVGTEIGFAYYKAAAVAPTVRVPNLFNQTRVDAETALRNAGLNPRAQEGNEANDPAQVGRVYAQSVAANVEVAPGREVVFQTFKAAAAAGNRMPNVVNMFKVDAEIALQRAGIPFQAMAVRTTDDDRLLGMVYAQSTPANALLRPGEPVNFQYYYAAQPAGVSQVKVPWVTNMSRWDAEMRLLRAGFIPRAVKANETNAVTRLDLVHGDRQNPKGHQGDGPNERSLAPFGSEVTYEYEFKKDVTVTGPYDAASPDPIPNLIPLANADDSLEIAWTRRDGKSVYSRFSGPNWSTAQHQELSNALRYLAGLTRDDSGNTYLASTRMEYLRAENENGHRPNVVHLLKKGPNQAGFELFLDLNRPGYSPPVNNPQNQDSALFHTSRLAHGNGELSFVFAQNHGGGHQASNILAVGTDGSSKYVSNLDQQHSADVRLIFDGTDFVMAQSFEAGLGLSKLTRNGDKRQWSNHILVYQNAFRNQGDFDSYLRIGGIARTSTGYLLAFVQTRGGGGNYGPQDWNVSQDGPVYTITVPRNFETLQKFEWIKPANGGWRAPEPAGNFNPSVLMNPPRDRVLIRPQLVDLQNGKYLVMAEQWNWRNPTFEGTYATLINANGQRISDIKGLGMVRLHASNDAFFLPRSRQAAWVTGDTVNNQLRLCTVDENLNLQSYTLSLQ